MQPLDFADFQPALHAATIMNAFERPWCISGGWAIDLWLGRLTRAHARVEVAIFREDQIAVRDFLGRRWRFFVDVPGGTPRPWPDDRQMLMLPLRAILAVPQGRQSGGLNIALHECDAVDWVYPGDARIRWPRDQWMLRGAFGVPVLSPHLALLLKSGGARAQDQLDFHSSLPDLAPELKQWLAWAIGLVRPDHPWRAGLPRDRVHDPASDDPREARP